MYLKKLSLTNFKNYSQADYQFSDKINCFVGNNGVGKTNLMDAIHYLSFCKSYFNPIDSQNIRHHQDYFAINGTCIRNDDSSRPHSMHPETEPPQEIPAEQERI
jgi:DNA replication and repair protein RecF